MLQKVSAPALDRSRESAWLGLRLKMSRHTRPVGACLLALVFLWGLVACATKPAPRPVEPQPIKSAGPLIELLPPGPSFVLQARPERLMQAQAARALWRLLVTEEREASFRERTLVDPLTVEELVVIEVGEGGYLLLARGPFDAEAVVRAAGTRLAVRDVESDAPVLRREGLAGTGRFAYAVLDPHALLVAKDTQPALLASVLGRLDDDHAPRVLDHPDAEALYEKHQSAPLILIAPRPLTFPPESALSVLLAEERALAITVEPSDQALHVSLGMRGVFPEGIENNLRTWAQSLGSTDLGRVFGLSEIGDNLGIQREPEGVIMRANVRALDLMSGVRLLFFDGMREIFPAE